MPFPSTTVTENGRFSIDLRDASQLSGPQSVSDGSWWDSARPSGIVYCPPETVLVQEVTNTPFHSVQKPSNGAGLGATADPAPWGTGDRDLLHRTAGGAKLGTGSPARDSNPELSELMDTLSKAALA